MTGVLADLHIHTALSPCADRGMSPGRIVREAMRKGLAMIAVCDHNSAGNVAAVTQAAVSQAADGRAASGRDSGFLTVISGIELTTIEEVHLIGLFPSAEAACEASARVRETLPEQPRLREAAQPFWSEQLLFDAQDRQIGVEERMLGLACGFDLSAAVALIRAHGGLAVAAHIDRRSFSVLGQLGLFPREVSFDAAEISAAGVARGCAGRYRHLGIPLVSSSDGHTPQEIGSGCTALLVEEPSFAELALALREQDGRRCAVA